MASFKAGELELEAKMPKRSVINEADLKYTAAVNKAFREGIMSTQECVELMRERNIWTDEDEKNSSEYKLEMMKKTALLDSIEDKEEGHKIAHEIKELRMKIFRINAKLNSILSNSAEEYATRIKEDYLTSECIFSKDGKKYFDSYDKYLDADDYIVAICKQKVVAMLNGLDENLSLNFPESKYLIENGFMTKDGIEIDQETGYRIDPLTGLLVDDNYDFVDKNGNKIDEFGEKIKTEEKPKPKRGRKKKEK